VRVSAACLHLEARRHGSSRLFSHLDFLGWLHFNMLRATPVLPCARWLRSSDPLARRSTDWSESTTSALAMFLCLEKPLLTAPTHQAVVPSRCVLTMVRTSGASRLLSPQVSEVCCSLLSSATVRTSRRLPVQVGHGSLPPFSKRPKVCLCSGLFRCRIPSF
jgi:hypothetical protein